MFYFLLKEHPGCWFVIAMYSMSGIRDIMSRSLKYLCGKKTFPSKLVLDYKMGHLHWCVSHYQDRARGLY